MDEECFEESRNHKENDAMIILHITDIMKPQGNGVAYAVSAYLKYEGEVATVASYNLDKDILADNSQCFNYSNFKAIEDLPEPFNNPDIVIFNEVYKPKFLKLYKECLRKEIPYVIIPHGCLTRESQRKKILKKKIANALLFDRFINNAVALQFLCDGEKDHSVFCNDSIVFGNGVRIIGDNNPNTPTSKDYVYIGRYEVEHKGLDILVKVCASNKQWFVDNSVRINLYGRDSANGLTVLKELIDDFGVADIVRICGPIYGDDKDNLLNSSYCYLQCSRFEGQPMSIIEALAHGCPCIVTNGTNFGEYMKKNNCGICCNSDDEIFKAIKSIYFNNKDRNNMSKNAFRAARNDFELHNIATKTIEGYRGLLK